NSRVLKHMPKQNRRITDAFRPGGADIVQIHLSQNKGAIETYISANSGHDTNDRRKQCKLKSLPAMAETCYREVLQDLPKEILPGDDIDHIDHAHQEHTEKGPKVVYIGGPEIGDDQRQADRGK